MSFVVVTGKKIVNQEETNVIYLANVEENGYCYFSDDKSYRCLLDGSELQLLYPSKNIWMRTTNIFEIGIISFDIVELLSRVFNNSSGGGAFAPNPQVETAVRWAVDKVTNNYVTYADIGSDRHLGEFDATQYDCSSFIITAFLYAGFNINASYTGNMRSGFEAAGFVWHESDNGYLYAKDLLRGDILLNEANHTQMYIGNSTDVNCGGTPGGTPQHWDYYEYGGHSGWDGFLRYGA